MKPKLTFPTDPRQCRPGYHLVRVNSTTEIEVRDGDSDTQARQLFVEKLNKIDKQFYNNLVKEETT